MNKQNMFFVIIGLVVLLAFSYFLISTDNTSQIENQVKSNISSNPSRIKVVTTLFPIYDMAKGISKSEQVKLLLPPGVEAHSFEPTPLDIQTISQADVFIYTGNIMEPWVEKVLASMEKKPVIVDVSQGITLMETDTNILDLNRNSEHSDEESHNDEIKENEHSEDEYSAKEETFHNDEDHNHKQDPHFWLDFDNAQIMVNTIAKSFVEKDSANQDFYNENSQKYKDDLVDLDNSFKNRLNTCSTRTFVHGGHYAFGYLAKKYNLSYLAAKGFNNDSEPTIQDITNLINIVRESNTKAIFTEEMVDPKVANLISTETSVPVRAISAGSNISKDDLSQNKTFFDIMRETLNELSIGLGCK